MPKYWVCTHIWLYTYTVILLLDLLISGISYQLISSGAFFTLLTTPLVSLCYDYASILCCLLYAYVFPVESDTGILYIFSYGFFLPRLGNCLICFPYLLCLTLYLFSLIYYMYAIRVFYLYTKIILFLSKKSENELYILIILYF